MKIMTNYEQSNAVQIPTRVESKTHLTRRGKAALVLGGVVLGLGAAKGGAILHDHQRDFSVKQLHEMPQQAVTVHSGEGALQILRSVEPAILKDAEKRHELIDYINNEGLNHSNGGTQLQEHQQVLVPLVPGVEHLQQK